MFSSCVHVQTVVVAFTYSHCPPTQACVETLYVTLCTEYREIVVPALLELIKDLDKPCNADSLPDILARDAG